MNLKSNFKIPYKLQQIKAYQISQKLNNTSSQENWKKAHDYLSRHPQAILLWKFKNILNELVKFIFLDLPKSDWLRLIAAPILISVTGIIITSEVQEENQQNKRLNDYFDKIETLLFEKKLMDENVSKDALVIARARTLNAMRILDKERNIELTTFLQDGNLITSERKPHITRSVISLFNADYRNFDLRESNLKWVNLSGSNFEKADLTKANLQGAFFIESNLSNTKLEEANLKVAKLKKTDLRNSNLKRANLHEADLEMANLDNANLKEVIDLFAPSLHNACFADRAKYSKDFIKENETTFVEYKDNEDLKSSCNSYWRRRDRNR